jgi:hypothetical protein
MEVNLIHNGYSVERRKLYPTNRILVSTQLEITLPAQLI